MWEVESGASGLKACGLQGLGFKHSALLCREICRQGPEQSRIVWVPMLGPKARLQGLAGMRFRVTKHCRYRFPSIHRFCGR